MKLDVSDNVFWILVWICVATIIISITIATWNYNITAVKCYTDKNYEEVSDIGSSLKYWRKAK